MTLALETTQAKHSGKPAISAVPMAHTGIPYGVDEAKRNNLPNKQASVSNSNKQQTLSTTLWSVSKEPNTPKDNTLTKSRVRTLGEWCRASGNPPGKHITCAQTAAKWFKNCVNLPHLLCPNTCGFAGQREASVTQLCFALLHANSSKTSFTCAALEEAPLTNTNLHNAFKHRAGTEEQGLC